MKMQGGMIAEGGRVWEQLIWRWGAEQHPGKLFGFPKRKFANFVQQRCLHQPLHVPQVVQSVGNGNKQQSVVIPHKAGHQRFGFSSGRTMVKAMSAVHTSDLNIEKSKGSNRQSGNQTSKTIMTVREDPTRLACPGCGVYMQQDNPKAPGYYKMPTILEEKIEEEEEIRESIESAVEDDKDEVNKDKEEEEELLPEPEWVKQLENKKEDDGVESWNDVSDTKDAQDAWNKLLNESNEDESNDNKAASKQKLVVCARCHSLRAYGKVKDASAENLLPDFDFEEAVGSRLKKAYGRRAVVVMVVDAVDFDGSFPRKVAALLKEVEENPSSWKDGEAGNTPRFIIAATKIDLLPGQVAPIRLEQWIRRRASAGGAPHPSGVHLVSAVKTWGLIELGNHIRQLAGPRGDVWFVGAQNAGKSSLINSLSRVVGQKKSSTRLTEASLPGTTIGVLKLEGVLPDKVRLYDTPGILHPHQITTRLNVDELKLVQNRKELRAKTFRAKVGNTIHVGGMLRLDVVKAPGESIYLTIWVSAFIACHMGKTENAEGFFEKHIGEKLQPPLDKKRWPELGSWVSHSVRVSGDTWTKSSVDVAIAGLGWVACGLKGDAIIKVWTFEGVGITRRDAVVLDYAPIFERPGFTVVKGAGPTSKKSAKSDASSKKVKQDIMDEVPSELHIE